ncbi:hypothetical protein ACFL60_07915 [Candidatus Omnitrophota bacterium]
MKKKLAILILAFLLIGSSVFAEITKEKNSPVKEKASSLEKIVFNVVASNPSATKTQSVPIKTYLPTELTPEDVLDKGGLELKHDPEKSVYYLFKDSVMLEPKQTKVFTVKVKDIWVIPEDEIKALRKQTERIAKQLKNISGGKEAVDSIYKRLDEITASQNDYTVSRKEHIGAYRLNLKVVEEIKEDIVKTEKLAKVPKKLPKAPKKSLEPEKPKGFLERIRDGFSKNKK